MWLDCPPCPFRLARSTGGRSPYSWLRRPTARICCSVLVRSSSAPLAEMPADEDVVGQGRGMNAAVTVPRPNTRDMLGIHQIFRDAFGCAPQLVGSVCNDHSDRVAAVAAYYANVLALLHAHHEGEDELIWPKLVERAPDDADLIERMQSQHAGLLDALTEAERRLSDWMQSSDIDRGVSLAA